MNSLETALGGRGDRVSARGPSPVEHVRGAKRTAAELRHLQDELLTFVTKNPGLRIEQINKQLSTSTKDLQLPMRKLISEGSLKTKGEKRSTTYFPSRMKS